MALAARASPNVDRPHSPAPQRGRTRSVRHVWSSRPTASASSSSTSTSVQGVPSRVLPPLLSRLPVHLSTPVAAGDHSQQADLPSYARFPSAPPHVGWTDSHLPDIDPASLALHEALLRADFHASSEDYARLEYARAFNWQDVQLPAEIEREWYIVAFRSVRRQGADTAHLYAADREAHEEAVTAGGLLLYWYGAVNQLGENLATCIWQSRAHALSANRNRKHAIAAKLASAAYETYALERYVLVKERGRLGVYVKPWEGGEVRFQ